MLKKLKGDKIIEKLFKEGKSLFTYPIKLVYTKEILEDQATGDICAGVSVSKRNFKKAVDRNRIKRQMRASIHENTNLLLDIGDINFMTIYVSKERLDYSVIHKSLTKLLAKMK